LSAAIEKDYAAAARSVAEIRGVRGMGYG